MPDSIKLSVSPSIDARRPACADDPTVVVIGDQPAAAVTRHRRDPGVAKMPAEDRALDPSSGFHGDRERELMRGAVEIARGKK